MGIRVGPWDPLQLSFQILNTLMKGGKITIVTVVGILRESNQFKSELLIDLIKTNEETNIKVNQILNQN